MSTNSDHCEKGKIVSVINMEKGFAGDDNTVEYSQISAISYDRKLSVSGIHYANLPEIITLDIRMDEASVAESRQALIEVLAWIDSLPSV